MSIFSKRETLLQNMALMGMMAAINVIFSLFAAFLPLGALFVMIVLPLVSLIVALYCRPKYYLIYLVATIGVCLAATAWDLKNTIFYTIPSIITGLSYGLLLRKKIPSSLTIFLVTLIQFLLTYVSLYLILWIYGIDMITLIGTLLGLASSPVLAIIGPSAILAYSLAETMLSHLFIISEISHLKIEEYDDTVLSFFYPIISMVFAVLAVVMAFVSPLLAYVFLVVALYWACFSGTTLFSVKTFKPAYIVLGVLLFASVLLVALFYSKMPEYGGLTLFALPLLSLDGAALLNNLVLFKKKANSTRIGS